MQNGRAQHLSVIRHKEIDMCPVSALATFLFKRFVLDREEFPVPGPDEDKQKKWYAAPLFNSSRSSSAAISYNSCLAKVTELFVAHKIATTKKCHAMRLGGARNLDQNG